MTRLSTVLLLSLLTSTIALAQTLEQWTAWGDAAMERKEYYGASRFYAGAIAIDGGRMALQWKQAESCRLSNQYDKAVELYERVHHKDMGRTYPEALRWLGEMQLCTGSYDDAKRTWERVLRKERNEHSFNSQRARNAIIGCTLALEAIADTDSLLIEHLDAPVNTYDSEFGARIGPDSALYFSSLRGELDNEGEVKDTMTYFTAIYKTVNTGGTWAEPVVLPDPINGTGDNGNTTWTSDGRWILFTRCEAGAPCRIHIAERVDDGYGEARPIPGLGDSLHSTQPVVARLFGHEMPVLFFVSDRLGGPGGMDIWHAHLVEGKAVDVHPLQAPVNSLGNERCPWYDEVSGTLWFSSDFHAGMGGFDIFTAPYGNDVFGPVTNGGAPLNGPANDLYPSYDPLRNEGWLTSNRIGSFAAKGETCCNDLYRFSRAFAPTVHLDTTGERTIAIAEVGDPKERLVALAQRFPLKLYFHNDDPEPRSWSETTAQDYAEAYRRYRSLIPVYEKEGDAETLDDFFRDEVDRGYLELVELTIALREVLATGTSLTLDVRGHASPLARSEYNRNLSMRRIESLRNYLRVVDNGTLVAYLDGSAANGAQLIVRAMPFGEDRSVAGVNDDLRQLDLSVYSVEASMERRIEVEALQLHVPVALPGVERHRKKLGEVVQEQERRVPFELHNNGSTAMMLLDSKADCGCTTLELPKAPIAPGRSVAVTVVFNGHAPVGPFERKVTIRTNGSQDLIELTIEGIIVP